MNRPPVFEIQVTAWRVSGKLGMVSVRTQILPNNASFHYGASALAGSIASFSDTPQAATTPKIREI